MHVEEPTFLWCHFLIIHKALPGHPAGIKGEIALDGLERRSGRFIAPDLVADLLSGGFVGQAPIRGLAFPFT